MQITLETRKRNTRFYVLRQWVPEGRSIEAYASFKQAKPWPWHVEVIPGVSVVGLVTHEQLRKVVWGIIIKNFMHTHTRTHARMHAHTHTDPVLHPAVFKGSGEDGEVEVVGGWRRDCQP